MMISAYLFGETFGYSYTTFSVADPGLSCLREGGGRYMFIYRGRTTVCFAENGKMESSPKGIGVSRVLTRKF